MQTDHRPQLEQDLARAQVSAQAARARLLSYTDARAEARRLPNDTLAGRERAAREMAAELARTGHQLASAQADGRALAYDTELCARANRAALDHAATLVN